MYYRWACTVSARHGSFPPSQFLCVLPGGAQSSLLLLLRRRSRGSCMCVCKWVHKITACSLHPLMSAVWKVWITGTAPCLCGNNEPTEHHFQNVLLLQQVLSLYFSEWPTSTHIFNHLLRIKISEWGWFWIGTCNYWWWSEVSEALSDCSWFELL